MFGFKTTAFIRGDEGVSNQMLALNKLWGMEFIYTDRTSYRDKETLFENHFGQNENAYFVNEGGAGVLGAKGCQEIVTELTENYQHIFCAVGTATTLQGITQAIKNLQLTTKAEGICVLKGAENIDEELCKNQLQDYYKIHHQFHEGGYAKSNPKLMDFITHFASKTGILLDQVYTAKMMLAVFTLAEQDYFEPNSKILCVHTGGILGLLGVLK
jgi:1-aminocyclopropane-1-carboxylate deaminase